MTNKLTRKITAILLFLPLTGCAISPEGQEALAGLFGAISVGANTTLQAQQNEQQQLMRYQNQALQKNEDYQRARSMQQLCMNPANRQYPICQRPQ